MLANFKGLSVEKLPRLLAGNHHVTVQFIPTESSLKMIEKSVKLMMIEKSKKFTVPLTGRVLVNCIYVPV